MRVKVSEDDAGKRFDAFLAPHAGSRSVAERIAAVLGIAKSYRVKAGESFEFELPAAVPNVLTAEDIPLDIVYEDSELLVINKAKGMVVHPAPGHHSGTLVNALLAHCGRLPAADAKAAQIRPGIVHRIDKDTSGLLVAAKTESALRSLSSQLADRSLSRVYDTVIIGAFKDASGVIDLPIGRNPREREKMAVVKTGGKPAITRWETTERYRGYSRLLCKLETGRTHQIRVHLASAGHPVLGDALYGSAKNRFGLNGQCLHAAAISFAHPSTGERMSFETDLPEYFRKVIDKMSE
ncbi:MAG: RluA family pseudouridine synthase [Oscillospiraceae bacterium]|jgi:23S rRNA pseudouridine1911/1915/1917 synthase|nr:RluA family pseudouridine synthase [Oscillospiraceae bacterium]